MITQIHITLDAPAEFERFNDEWVQMRLNELIGGEGEGMDIPHVDREPLEMICCKVTDIDVTRTV